MEQELDDQVKSMSREELEQEYIDLNAAYLQAEKVIAMYESAMREATEVIDVALDGTE